MVTPYGCVHPIEAISRTTISLLHMFITDQYGAVAARVILSDPQALHIQLHYIHYITEVHRN